MIGIIGAMPEEVQALEQQTEQTQEVRTASRRFVRGVLAGQEVVMAVSGVGKVNAASCTQQMIDLFSLEAIINTGIAGAIAPGLKLGDIVIARDAVQHDVDTTDFGEAPGQIPDMEQAFVADEHLIQVAVAAGEAAAAASDFHSSVHVGRILSGDIFLTDKDRKERLRHVFDGLCVEMEGAAVGHVAHINHIPWVVSRCISDQADNPVVTDYLAFKQEAVSISVQMARHIIEALSEEGGTVS